MLDAQTACTLEIDDVDAAVAEITEQLDLNKLGAHTVGLVSALPDYLESGVVVALQDALPFDIIGQTSIATTSPQGNDLDQLSLLVLSSDDIAFSLALSDPITSNDPTFLTECYNRAAASHAEKPDLIVGYAPLLMFASCDYFVNGTNEASGGVPFFGSLAVDGTVDYHESQVIFEGVGYRDRLIYLLVYGDVHPRFYLAGITHKRIVNDTGVVTSSEGSQLQTVNGEPVSEFLKDKGISTNEEGVYVGVNTFPYIVDYNDGTDPVVRVMFAVTPDGYAVCGGDIPVGATLGVSYFDKGEILESSETCMEKIAQDIAQKGAQALLFFSCVGRFFNLGYDTDAETQLLHDALDSTGVPYTFTYSGGEICPVAHKDGSANTTNRAHNSTFIAMAL